jgi:fructuronate reductase
MVANLERPRLSLSTLPLLAEEHRPLVNPRDLPVRAVHLGIGAFHRAHQAVFTEEAVAASGEPWGICGVTQRSADVVGQLGPQDCLYSLSARDGAGERVRVIGAVREILWAREQTEQLLSRLAGPDVTVVTLTVTEKGYQRDPASGRLRAWSPDVAADLSGRPPLTVIGQLVEAFARRAKMGSGPLNVLSCDNLPDNGKALGSLIREYCALRADGKAILDWVDDAVRFPSSVVDRIVPATTHEDRRHIADLLGVEDYGAVVTEPFRQWVIEDDFAAPRPPWELAGATLTSRVAPYERAKLRLLNGAHSTIAYLGALAGYELVSDAAREGGPIGEVARRLMERDVVPTLELPEGFDVSAYEDDVMRRFKNPAVLYRTLQIATDGSQKLPQRLLGTLVDRRSKGAVPHWAGLGVAAWAHFVTARRSDTGQVLPLDDPMEAPKAVVDALMGLEEVFPPELREDNVVRELLTDLVGRLSRDGAEATARALVDELP